MLLIIMEKNNTPGILKYEYSFGLCSMFFFFFFFNKVTNYVLKDQRENQDKHFANHAGVVVNKVPS